MGTRLRWRRLPWSAQALLLLVAEKLLDEPVDDVVIDAPSGGNLPEHVQGFLPAFLAALLAALLTTFPAAFPVAFPVAPSEIPLSQHCVPVAVAAIFGSGSLVLLVAEELLHEPVDGVVIDAPSGGNLPEQVQGFLTTFLTTLLAAFLTTFLAAFPATFLTAFPVPFPIAPSEISLSQHSVPLNQRNGRRRHYDYCRFHSASYREGRFQRTVGSVVPQFVPGKGHQPDGARPGEQDQIPSFPGLVYSWKRHDSLDFNLKWSPQPPV